MMQRRRIGFVVVVMTMLAAACVPEGPAPVVVPVHVTCDGASGDVASSVGDSAATVGLMQTLVPGSHLFDFPGATITATVPATADGPFPVSFVFDWGALPASGPEFTIFRDLLHVPTVTVTSVGLDVSSFGPGGDTMSAGPSSSVAIDTAAALAPPAIRLDHTVVPSGTGTIRFLLKAARLTVKVDSTVAGVSIGTITLVCGASPTAPEPAWPSTLVN